MTTQPTSLSISRRTALASLGVGSLAFATSRLAVLAQEASPVATAYPMAGHPIIGVWQWADPADPSHVYAYAIISDEGTYTEGWSRRFGLALGTWRATGERTADLVYVQQSAVPRDLFDPAQVMEGLALSPPDSANLAIWRLALTVEETGNTLMQTGGFEVFNTEGEIIHSQAFDGIGTRMVLASFTEGATPT